MIASVWQVTRPVRLAWLATDGLWSSSVHVAPGAPHVLDARAARRVIGNRPILVAEMPEDTDGTADTYDLCPRIAANFPRTVVLVFEGLDFPGACAGPGWPQTRFYRDRSQWAYGIASSAWQATRVRTLGGDLTPMVAEFVTEFDIDVEFEKLHVAPREPARGIGYWSKVGGSALVGLLAAVGLFVLTRLGLRLAGRLLARRRLRLGARAAAQADVHRLAGLVLDTDPPRSAWSSHRLADAAEQYAAAVAALEHGRSLHDFEQAARLAQDGIGLAEQAWAGPRRARQR